MHNAHSANRKNSETLARFVDTLYFSGENPELVNLTHSIQTIGLSHIDRRHIFADTRDSYKGVPYDIFDRPLSTARVQPAYALPSPVKPYLFAHAAPGLHAPSMPQLPQMQSPCVDQQDETFSRLRRGVREAEIYARMQHKCEFRMHFENGYFIALIGAWPIFCQSFDIAFFSFRLIQQ